MWSCAQARLQAEVDAVLHGKVCELLGRHHQQAHTDTRIMRIFVAKLRTSHQTSWLHPHAYVTTHAPNYAPHMRQTTRMPLLCGCCHLRFYQAVYPLSTHACMQAPSAEDMERLPYVRAVVDEALRMASPSDGVLRIPQRDFTLPDGKL